jgi:hypothetical protein
MSTQNERLSRSQFAQGANPHIGAVDTVGVGNLLAKRGNDFRRIEVFGIGRLIDKSRLTPSPIPVTGHDLVVCEVAVSVH